MPWEELPRRQQQVLTRLLMSSIDRQTPQFELRPVDIQSWFEVSASTARSWLHEWVETGFLEAAPTETGQRVRRFLLSLRWRKIVEMSITAGTERM